MKNNKTTVFLLHHISSSCGGAEQSFVSLVNTICSLHYNVVAILPDIKGSMASRLKTNCELVQLPLLRIQRTSNPFRLLFLLFNLVYCQLRLMLLMRKYKADIIHSNSTNTHLYAALPSKILGIKSVWHIRDVIPPLVVSKILACCSDRIFCVSSKVMSTDWINKKKITIVPNALDANEYTINRSNSETGNVRNKECIVIAQIGQLIPWKNHRLTIAVAEKFLLYGKKIKFFIIGSDMFNAYPDYESQLLQLIKDKNLNDHVSLIPYVENHQTIYPQIDILFHPAFNEPFGRVIIEAMSYAKPVVAINSGGPSEIVIDNETGFLVNNGDIDELVARIQVLIEGSELRASMGNAGRRRVIKYYDSDTQRTRIKEEYKQLQGK